MNASHSLANALDQLPPEWPGNPLKEIRALLSDASIKVVVLDDDPTGTQTVEQIKVVTQWDTATLRREFDDPAPGFFILTNSRSVDENASIIQHREIAANVRKAAAGRPYTIISRSDSTLRGHFPAETDTLQEELGPADLVAIAPFFLAGNRYTIDNEHYLAEEDTLIPVSKTPFAQDSVFGYKTSTLPDWVEEKSRGRYAAADVASVSLETIRKGGPNAVFEQLEQMRAGAHCIVNAAAQSDMDVFIAAALRLETTGKRILYRSAAATVASRLGISPPAPLPAEFIEKGERSDAGLFIVGSYVPKTTAQLDALLRIDALEPIELDVAALLDATDRDAFVATLRERLIASLEAGKDTLLYTSRNLIAAHQSAHNHLEIGSLVSNTLVDLVARIPNRPRFIVSKGGITSSDIATKALGIKRAMILGQLLPGVPVWRTLDDARFPGLDYVVFPGNVGNNDALVDAYEKLTRERTT